MVKSVAVLLGILACVLSIGCSKTLFDHQDPRCPFVERGGCQSMEQINRMVNSRRFTPDGQYVQQAQCIGD